MQAHDLQAALRDLPLLTIAESTTEAEAAASMREVDAFDACALGLVRFAGETPWERHPGDELLHVLEGEIELTVLTDEGVRRERIRAGSIFVVPKGLWHRQHARRAAALLFATPVEGNETSVATDPRSAVA